MRRHPPKTPLLEEQAGWALLVVLPAQRFEPSLQFYVGLAEKKLPRCRFSRGMRHGGLRLWPAGFCKNLTAALRQLCPSNAHLFFLKGTMGECVSWELALQRFWPQWR